MQRIRLVIALFVVALTTLAAACGGDIEPGDTEFAGTVRDSAGIPIVENARIDPWAEGDGWATEPLLTIGEAGGDPNYQFGQVAAVDALSDGSIAVLDQQAQRVQVYGPDGAYRRTIGGPGNGPGELSPQAVALFVGPGDTIVIPDIGNQRILLIPPSGEPGSSPLRMEGRTPIAFDMSDGGRLVSQRRAMNLGAPAGEAAEADLLLKQAYDGTSADTLLTAQQGNSLEMTASGPRFRLFAPEPQWTMLTGNRLAFATSDAYRINVYGPDGELERIVTFPHEPQPITRSEQQRLLDMHRRIGESNGMPPQAIDRMINQISFADFWPAFARLRGGPRSSLWVQRIRDMGEMTDEELDDWNPVLDQGSALWDVFDADGRYGGVVELPDRFTPLTIEGDRIYGVFRDEFDVQQVQVHRLSAGRAAG